MHVYIDDSGCGGFQFDRGSTPHLVFAACIFHEPVEIERLAAAIADLRQRTHHQREFKFNKTKDRLKDEFFSAIDPVRFTVRAIYIDKQYIYSSHLRTKPSALKSYAIRMLLSNSYGQINGAKVFVDGQDTAAFGIADKAYLQDMANRGRPGSIVKVNFIDSKDSVGIQTADMVAGAIGRGYRPDSKNNPKWLHVVRPRTYYPRGTIWDFCSRERAAAEQQAAVAAQAAAEAADRLRAETEAATIRAAWGLPAGTPWPQKWGDPAS